MKKLILIKHEGQYKEVYTKFDECLRYLRLANIPVVKFNKLRLIIETEHVEIRILTYYDNLRGIKADELFRFPAHEAQRLRRTDIDKEPYKRSWIEYVVAEEKSKKIKGEN